MELKGPKGGRWGSGRASSISLGIPAAEAAALDAAISVGPATDTGTGTDADADADADTGTCPPGGLLDRSDMNSLSSRCMAW